jgi:ABC-2 type transport system permease protein
MFKQFWASRLWALIRKEINQITRNKQLIAFLIIPPTIQILVYGFALNPDVHHLKLGVVDFSRTSVSRELVAAMTENRIFDAEALLFSEKALATQVETGQLTAGIVIPPEFSRDVAAGKSAEIQVVIDGVDANTAGIASSYISQIIQQFGQQHLDSTVTSPMSTQVIFLYNQGLVSSWFFVPGVMGVVLMLIGSIGSSVTVIREKDTGTLEQLFMTPANAWEILIAKVLPLFILLMGDVLFTLTIGRSIFGVPFRGSFLLFMALSGLYVFVGIGVGIMMATLCESQQQVVLTTFFINLPMVQLSGAIAPIESMPPFFQTISLLNPLRYYISITRGILLKGVGLEALWAQTCALSCFAIILLAISTRRFRNQIG